MNRPEIIIVPSLFFMIGYICWLVVTFAQRRQQLKLLTEFNGKLLDRLGSVNDFSQFLQTEAGSRFMRDLAAEPINPASRPQERILRAAQVGVVLVCLGLGLLLVGFFAVPGQSEEGLTTIGVIALSVGVGFVISAAASYRLSMMLGLLRRNPTAPSLPVTSQV
ncbi:MAG TPA: hypothetical protein VM032_11675 [Vicinamibacterales bacterium]|nr:hypothetical protein [Vicinamibacterales bacterium]